MGIARLVLAGLAVLAFVTLIVVGVLSLVGALDPEPAAPPPAAATHPAATHPAATHSAATHSAAAPADSASKTAPARRVPTVLIQCVRDRCPTVFLKVVGGDVLLNREMTKDEQVQSFDAKIDVVLADSTALRVQVNGAARSPGEAGERQEFTVSRDQ